MRAFNCCLAHLAAAAGTPVRQRGRGNIHPLSPAGRIQLETPALRGLNVIFISKLPYLLNSTKTCWQVFYQVSPTAIGNIKMGTNRSQSDVFRSLHFSQIPAAVSGRIHCHFATHYRKPAIRLSSSRVPPLKRGATPQRKGPPFYVPLAVKGYLLWNLEPILQRGVCVS